MESVRTAIYDFFRSWNAARVVGKLPTELILQCFSWMSLQDRISAARVCKPWKDATEVSAKLWATADLDSQHALNLVVERSKQSPLHLATRGTFHLKAAFSPQASQRIHTLQVCIDTHDEEILTSAFRWHLPMLQDLRVYARLTIGWVPHDWSTLAPRLRSLTLHARGLNWDNGMTPFPHVVKLDMVTTGQPEAIPYNRIFSLFPNIVALRISVWDIPFSQAPATLKFVYFEPTLYKLETSKVLRQWRSSSSVPTRAVFQSPDDLVSALDMFFGSARSMRQQHCKLRCAELSGTRTINVLEWCGWSLRDTDVPCFAFSYNRLKMARAMFASPQIAAFTHLDIDDSTLVLLAEFAMTLPSIIELTLHLERWTEHLRRLHNQTRLFPALATVRLHLPNPARNTAVSNATNLLDDLKSIIVPTLASVMLGNVIQRLVLSCPTAMFYRMNESPANVLSLFSQIAEECAMGCVEAPVPILRTGKMSLDHLIGLPFSCIEPLSGGRDFVDTPFVPALFED